MKSMALKVGVVFVINEAYARRAASTTLLSKTTPSSEEKIVVPCMRTIRPFPRKKAAPYYTLFCFSGIRTRCVYSRSFGVSSTSTPFRAIFQEDGLSTNIDAYPFELKPKAIVTTSLNDPMDVKLVSRSGDDVRAVSGPLRGV